MDRIVLVGKVKSTKDPERLGRIQVELQGYSSGLEMPWIRQAGVQASKGFGHVFLPEDGDEVLVLRGDGDNLDQMVCLGGVYNGTNKPTYSNDDGKNVTKEIRTRSGNVITFTDKEGAENIHISTPDGKLSIDMDHSAGTITITSSDKVAISCPSGQVTVDCEQATVSAKSQVSITGKSKVSVASSGTVEINGSSQVNVSGGAKVSVEAAAISLSGKVSLG